MPQMLLPFFPDGVTYVNPQLAFTKRDGQVIYFNGQTAIGTHDANDLRAFRLFIAQFHVLGVAKQSDLAEAFGVSKKLVLRAVKLYREKGVPGFFEQRRTRGSAVLTPSVLAEAQALLDSGNQTTAVAKQLDLKPNTLAKAIRDGRLHKPRPQESKSAVLASSKSQRSLEDSDAPMGMAASNTTARVAASLGQLSCVPVEFQAASDVPRGGVLLALPALLAMGLLRRAKEHFQLPKGYYGLANIFLLLAFMALARLKTVEALRYHAPGEWGKLLGLDRAPEARTLRGKISHLAHEGQVGQWSAELCADWMKAQPNQATAFYVDGHVRVYHGSQTKLPRRYVARQKLCLRACTDYWVNAMDGQPFFVVYQDVDPGLIQVLERDILPRLERDAPNQPTEEEMNENPLLHRFTLVFDRAGYSPKLFKQLKERRIACLTYRKNPGENWPEHEFFPTKVALVSGNVVEMQLAERGVLLGSKKSEQIWVREIRRLMPCGHQTSVISTDYVSDAGPAAATMFARWCQENFFKYMRENYGIDRLMTYETQDIPGSTLVVNPEYRRLDREVRRLNGTLARKKAELGALELSTSTTINESKEAANVDETQLHRKAELYEETVLLQRSIDKFKQQRKAVGRHIPLSELPKEQSFRGLSGGTKQFLDTIKMIAYRAETAMAQIVREANPHVRNPRVILRGLYETEADLLPDYESKILYVRLHNQANQRADGVLSRLCDELNETDTVYPGTDLKLIYQLLSDDNGTPVPARSSESENNTTEKIWQS